MRKLHPHQEIVGLRGLTVEDFWIWGYSDLLTNVIRNTFAEFMVGFALGCLHTPKRRQDLIIFDYRDKRVAVRAASYVQSEPQKKKSKINFDLRTHLGYDEYKATLRPVDCYVFCLFTCADFENKEAARTALINTAYWRFYVVATTLLNEKVPQKKTIGVGWMDENCPDGPVEFPDLKRRIDQVLGLPTW